jgi:Mg2+/Co2+ transporter CorB
MKSNHGAVFVVLNQWFIQPTPSSTRQLDVVLNLIIQGEHKRTLLFQNDTENKCGVLRTSHLHQSTEKKKHKVLFQMTRVTVVVARLC